jgi:hypothetical protein
MKQDISIYIENCDICQKMIARRHKLYKLLQDLPRPENPWKDIFINFITELPPSLRKSRTFDAVLAIIDRYSKMTHFILIIIDVDAPALSEFIYNKIIKHHGIPKSIISNKKSIFTSK